MFDLGTSKFFLLAVIALLVVGPRDLPMMLRQIGKYVGMIKRQAAEFRSQFDDVMKESEIADLKKQVEDFGREAETTMREAEASVRTELDSVQEEANRTLGAIDAKVRGEHEAADATPEPAVAHLPSPDATSVMTPEPPIAAPILKPAPERAGA